jgi:RNA polymerase sigma factor (sigma-70 family)
MSLEPTVFVVDDDHAVRDSIRMLLKMVNLNTKAFPTADEFLEYYEPAMPGCLVLDIRMPGISGLVLQEQFYKKGIQIPIIFITAHGNVATSVRAMKLKAFDFLEKPFNDQDLIDRVEAALKKDAENRIEQQDREKIQNRLNSLTEREMEILRMVIAGMPNKVTASELNISQKTVEYHRKRIMEKMEAESLASLVRMIPDGMGDT